MTEIKKKISSAHTGRTIMFAELSKVMDHAIEDDNYLESLSRNVINKKSDAGIKETTNRLKKLYSFDLNYPQFKALKYFWQISEERDKPNLALLYAIGHDTLLAESIPIVAETMQGTKVTVEKLEENIEAYHPNYYTDKTRISIAQNIASSWKQAGYITGKVKNIRTQPDISYNLVAFAFFMAFLDDLRGDFIFTSKWVKALCLYDAHVRQLAAEASINDLIQYQYAGSITVISFNNLTNKLQINVV